MVLILLMGALREKACFKFWYQHSECFWSLLLSILAPRWEVKPSGSRLNGIALDSHSNLSLWVDGDFWLREADRDIPGITKWVRICWGKFLVVKYKTFLICVVLANVSIGKKLFHIQIDSRVNLKIKCELSNEIRVYWKSVGFRMRRLSCITS